ncbi:MAG: hypothetical protein ACRDHN_17295 [Thermomicrobiales bacterium]
MEIIALISFFVLVLAWLVIPNAKTPGPVAASTVPFASAATAAGVAD